MRRGKRTRCLVALWVGWLLLAVAYAGGSVLLGSDARSFVCDHPDHDSHYGDSSLRLVPFGVECKWYFDALGEQAVDRDQATVEVERGLAFPLLTPMMNVLLVSTFLWLVKATLQKAEEETPVAYRVSVVKPGGVGD